MSGLKDRVTAIEFEQWRKQHVDVFNRPDADLEFYAVHGVFPESADSAMEREFVVGGWKTTVILERCIDA